MNNKFDLKDISVVIPTYNRSLDLKETLSSLKTFKDLNEIIVVDQSKDNLTKKLINSLKNNKIKYVYSDVPSITIARNLGVKKSSKSSKIICFIDDDVTLEKGYFSEILKIFNNNPNAKAAAAYVNPVRGDNKVSIIENFIKSLFFLDHFEIDKMRMISAYGNTWALDLKKTINTEWLSGVNMNYKKEIFDKQKFDENLLGYTVAEDIDFSHTLYKRFPDSIFITPYAKIVHRLSDTERYPTEKISYINQVDHFYFYFKHFNKNLWQKLMFSWSLIGITFLRTIRLVIKPTKINYLKWKYFLKSLFYCILNQKEIKRGKLRGFKA